MERDKGVFTSIRKGIENKVRRIFEDPVPLGTNAPGRYRVDQRECMGCGGCIGIAPHNFGTTEVEGSSKLISAVIRQPRSYAEVADCQKAVDICPMQIVYADGVNAVGMSKSQE